MADGVQKGSDDRRQWRYPDASEHPDDVVYVYERWCKSCGICYSMCPQGVFTSDKSGLSHRVQPRRVHGVRPVRDPLSGHGDHGAQAASDEGQERGEERR